MGYIIFLFVVVIVVMYFVFKKYIYKCKIEKKEFIKISNGIWKYIFKKTYVPVVKPSEEDKDLLLDSLYHKIIHSKYCPSTPREYIVSNKYNFISRIVPVLDIEDILVFYFCVKVLETTLAKNRADGTYGGFCMGGEIMKKENDEFNNLDEISLSTSSYTYNSIAWVRVWRDFQEKVYQYSMQEQYSHFVIFDIANFYDSINLLILKKKIQNISEKEHFDIIELLFIFLSGWNRKFENEWSKSIGLPQDEVGDPSRILANFYLQDFDKMIIEVCKNVNFQYLRYADDMIVMGDDENKVKEVLFMASKELSKIGLNINAGKVNFFSREEFEKYWVFNIFDKLSDNKDISQIEEGIEIFQKYKVEGVRFKEKSVLNRLINCDLKNIDNDKRDYIFKFLLEDEYLENCEEYQIRNIYKNMNNEDHELLKDKLDSLIDVVLFNKFHYVLLKVNDLFHFEEKRLKIRINKLKF